jgi:DNA-binding response OmpR family regulator
MKRKPTVLLADDDKVHTMMLSTHLRSRGYSVAAAYDATYTVMVVMKSPPDLIVLDIQMPGGTGKAALSRIKGSSKTSQIPVIVLSGFTDKKTIDEVLALGATDYLTKPVDFEKLDAAMRLALGAAAPELPAAPPAPGPTPGAADDLPPRDTWDT